MDDLTTWGEKSVVPRGYMLTVVEFISKYRLHKRASASATWIETPSSPPRRIYLILSIYETIRN